MSAVTKLAVLGLLILLRTKQFVGKIPITSPGSNISILSVRFLTAVNVIPDVTTEEEGDDVLLIVNWSDSKWPEPYEIKSSVVMFPEPFVVKYALPGVDPDLSECR